MASFDWKGEHLCMKLLGMTGYPRLACSAWQHISFLLLTLGAEQSSGRCFISGIAWPCCCSRFVASALFLGAVNLKWLLPFSWLKQCNLTFLRFLYLIADYVFKAIDALPVSAHPMTQFATGVMALQVGICSRLIFSFITILFCGQTSLVLHGYSCILALYKFNQVKKVYVLFFSFIRKIKL